MHSLLGVCKSLYSCLLIESCMVKDYRVGICVECGGQYQPVTSSGLCNYHRIAVRQER